MNILTILTVGRSVNFMGGEVNNESSKKADDMIIIGNGAKHSL